MASLFGLCLDKARSGTPLPLSAGFTGSKQVAARLEDHKGQFAVSLSRYLDK